MIRKISIFTILLVLSFLIVLLKPQNTNAQAMPVTQGKVDACLAAGNPAQTCLEQALYYLNVECGMVCRGPGGEGSTGSCSGSLCTITCGNGGSLTFPNDQPQCLSATQVCADVCYNGEKTDASFRCSPAYGGSKCCNKPNNPPAPKCGDDCTSDPAKCSTISGTCNKCLPNASGSGKSCQTPACGSGCSTDTDCSLAGSCSKCLPSGSGKTCQEPPAAPTATHTPVPAAPTATHTPVPATPTHTPIPTATATPSPTPDPFSPAMCKCDNMEISGIASGRATKVTAFGKVEGADVTHAKIQSMKFFLGKGPAGSTKIVLQSGELAATVIEEAATKVRYKSVWDFTMPALDRGVEHRLWTTFKCIKKIAFEPGITGSSVVLGSSTENVSIFSKIFAFFVNLGSDDKKTIATPVSTPELVAQVEKATSEGQVLGEKRNQLQLETFIPGEVTKKACQTIYFKLK